eukprot:Rmarinus@m.5930
MAPRKKSVEPSAVITEPPMELKFSRRGSIKSATYLSLNRRDVYSADCLQEFSGHKDGVTCLAVGTDNRVYTGSMDTTLRCWEKHTSRHVMTYKGHSGAVRCVALSLDERTMFSGADDNQIRMWYTSVAFHQGRSIGSAMVLEGHEGRINSLIILRSKDWTLCSASSDGTIRMWHAKSGEPISVLKGHTSAVTGVKESGLLLFSTSHDCTVRAWSLQGEETECLRVYKAPFPLRSVQVVGSALICLVDLLLASQTSPVRMEDVRMWDIVTGAVIGAFSVDHLTTYIIHLELVGMTLFCGLSNGFVCAYDLSTGVCVRLFEGHRDAISNLAIDGLKLYSSSMDGSLRLWTLQSSELEAAMYTYSAYKRGEAAGAGLDPRMCLLVLKEMGRLGMLNPAFQVVEDMKKVGMPVGRDVYDALISACVDAANFPRALEVCHEMKRRGMEVNKDTYKLIMADKRADFAGDENNLDNDKGEPEKVVASLSMDRVPTSSDLNIPPLAKSETGDPLKKSLFWMNTSLYGSYGVSHGNTMLLDRSVQALRLALELMTHNNMRKAKRQNSILTEESLLSCLLETYRSLVGSCFRCHDVDRAMQLLEELYHEESLVQPDAPLYGTVIRGYGRIGFFSSALDFYERMTPVEIQPKTVNELLFAAAESHALDPAVKILPQITQHGVQLELAPINKLIHACLVVKEMRLRVASHFFNFLKTVDLKPNADTYVSMVEIAISMDNLDRGRLYLRDMMAEGFPAPVHICNRLVQEYGVLGQVDNALDVVNKAAEYYDARALPVPHNLAVMELLISACVFHGDMTTATNLLTKLLDSGMIPNVSTLNVIIQGYVRAKNMVKALDIHERMETGGWAAAGGGVVEAPDEYTLETLFGACVKEGDTTRAAAFLRKLQTCLGGGEKSSGKDVSSFVANQLKRMKEQLIMAYSTEGKSMIAYTLLVEAEGEYEDPLDASVYVECLVSLVRNKDFGRAYEVLKLRGSPGTADTYNILIRGLCEANLVDKAQNMLKDMRMRGVVPNQDTYNLIVRVLVLDGRLDRAHALLVDTSSAGQTKNASTYAALMKGYNEANRPKDAIQVFRELISADVTASCDVYDQLIIAHVINGDPVKGARVSRRMANLQLQPSMDAFNFLVKGFGETGQLRQAFQTIDRMRHLHMPPDQTTYEYAVTYSIQGLELDSAERIFHEMKVLAIRPTTTTCNALIEGYGESRKLVAAQRVFEMIPSMGLERDSQTYKALMVALIKADKAEKAWKTFLDMKDRNLYLDSEGLISLLLAFCRENDAVRVLQLLHCMRSSEYARGFQQQELKILEEEMGRKREAGRVMVQRHIPENAYSVSFSTYVEVLNVCMSGRKARDTGHVVAMMVEDGMVPPASVIRGLLTHCVESDNVHTCVAIYTTLRDTGQVEFDDEMFTTVITGAAQAGKKGGLVQVGYEILEKFRNERPTEAVAKFAKCEVLLRGGYGNLDRALDTLHKYASQGSADIAVFNAALEAAFMCRDVERFEALFTDIIDGKTQYGDEEASETQIVVQADVDTWDLALKMFGTRGMLGKTFSVFKKMMGLKIAPSQNTYSALAAACCVAGDVPRALGLFRKMARCGIKPQREAYNALITALCHQGKLEESFSVLESMQQETVYPTAGALADLLQLCVRSVAEAERREAHVQKEREKAKAAGETEKGGAGGTTSGGEGEKGQAKEDEKKSRRHKGVSLAGIATDNPSKDGAQEPPAVLPTTCLNIAIEETLEREDPSAVFGRAIQQLYHMDAYPETIRLFRIVREKGVYLMLQDYEVILRACISDSSPDFTTLSQTLEIISRIVSEVTKAHEAREQNRKYEPSLMIPKAMLHNIIIPRLSTECGHLLLRACARRGMASNVLNLVSQLRTAGMEGDTNTRGILVEVALSTHDSTLQDKIRALARSDPFQTQTA